MNEVPTYDQLLWPTLCAMKSLGGSATNSEILDKIIETENIPESIQNLIHTDNRQTKLSYNIAWAKTYLRIYGAFENSARGVWAITEIGEKLSEEETSNIGPEVRRASAEERKKRIEKEQNDGEIEQDNFSEDNWKDQLLNAIRDIEADAFERLCQRILRESGFTKVQVTGRSGDGGIDGVGVLRIALLSFQVVFQCKKYKGSVPTGAVRDFRGAMVGRGDKGLLITTSTFTSDAQKEATRDGAPAIDLIDGNDLCELLKKLKLGVSTSLVEKISIDPEWFKKV